MKSIAKTLNDRTYTDYFYRLMLIARSIYKWSNLPNMIDDKWIERYLFNEGSCVFFYDKDRGFMVSKYSECGTHNTYEEPTFVRPIAIDYNGDALENHVDCVVIKNNDILLPTLPTLELFAYRLAEATRVSDVNVKAQKTPTILLCSENQKLSLKRALQQVDDNEHFIHGYKGLDIDSIKTLKLDAPIVFDKLTLHKHEIWNEAMTFLGLNNANMNKKERLVDDEVNANNEQVEASGNVFLSSRENCVKEINNLFDLNITVEKRIIDTPKLADVEKGVLKK